MFLYWKMTDDARFFTYVPHLLFSPNGPIRTVAREFPGEEKEREMGGWMDVTQLACIRHMCIDTYVT